MAAMYARYAAGDRASARQWSPGEFRAVSRGWNPGAQGVEVVAGYLRDPPGGGGGWLQPFVERTVRGVCGAA